MRCWLDECVDSKVRDSLSGFRLTQRSTKSLESSSEAGISPPSKVRAAEGWCLEAGGVEDIG